MYTYTFSQCTYSRPLLKNALLNKSRVLNSECPEHFSWEGSQKREQSFLCICRENKTWLLNPNYQFHMYVQLDGLVQKKRGSTICTLTESVCIQIVQFFTCVLHVLSTDLMYSCILGDLGMKWKGDPFFQTWHFWLSFLYTKWYTTISIVNTNLYIQIGITNKLVYTKFYITN